jgi:hypothetical protein
VGEQAVVQGLLIEQVLLFIVFLMPPQDLEKVGRFQSRKNQQINKCFVKKSGIGELVN